MENARVNRDSVQQAEALYQEGHEAILAGRIDEAFTPLERAIALFEEACGPLTQNAPSLYAEALHDMGLALLTRERLAEALPFFERALAQQPENAVFHNNLGMCLWKLKRTQEARRYFECALALNPTYAEACANLGMALLGLQEPFWEVEKALLAALKLRPDLPEALWHLAELRMRQERPVDCAALLERLAEIKPERRATLLARAGTCFLSVKDFGMAARFLEKALVFWPGNAEMLKLLGEVRGECGYVAEAKETFQQAAALKGMPSILRWKHLWYCPDFFESTQAIDAYLKWLEAELDEALAEKPVFDWKTLVAQGFSASFNITHLGVPYKDILEKYCRFFEPSFPLEAPEKRDGADDGKEGRIRVGFVVAPGHEGGFLRLVSGIVKGLPDERFERVLFYPAQGGAAADNGGAAGQGTQRATEQTAEEAGGPLSSQYAGQFASISGPGIRHEPYSAALGDFAQAVLRIRAARCDVIYHWKAAVTPWTLFLPMCRLAPVQCTSWGTHGTSGIRHIDHYVSWYAPEPEGAEAQYTEKLTRFTAYPVLEPSELLAAPEKFSAGAASRAEFGLPETGVLFFCPHRLPKYHPDFDSYLKGILEAVPQSYMILLSHGLRPALDQTRSRICKNLGPQLAKRVFFMPFLPRERFVRLMSVSDIALESPVYSGELTAYDAFCAGVPVVTQEGDYLVTRYTAGSYKALGITDAPVAHDREGYIAAAVRLANDEALRQNLGKRLKEGAAFFRDAQAITAEWAAFFERVVK